MARRYNFDHSQILRAEFLNTLQDILQSYIDIFLLTYSGNQVRAEASVTDPLAATVDGQMRQSPTTLVYTMTGAAGTRDVYLAVDTNDELYLSAATTPPTDPHRHVGTADWNGSVVTGVTTDATMQNADYLEGRYAAQSATPYAIAVTRDDGTLDPAWFPGTAVKTESLGTVKRMWAPSNAAFAVPTGYAIMDGRTLTPSQHSFPGVGTIVLPDMRNKIPLGADLTKVPGTAAVASNLAAAAPGRGAVGGSNAKVSSFDHNHAIAAHSHVTNNHAHSIGAHLHNIPDHTHPFTHFEETNHTDGTTDEWRGDAGTTSGAIGASTNTSSSSDSTSNSGSVTSSSDGGGSVTTSTIGALDVRPAQLGLVFLLRVL